VVDAAGATLPVSGDVGLGSKGFAEVIKSGAELAAASGVPAAVASGVPAAVASGVPMAVASGVPMAVVDSMTGGTVVCSGTAELVSVIPGVVAGSAIAVLVSANGISADEVDSGMGSVVDTAVGSSVGSTVGSTVGSSVGSGVG